MTCRSPAERAGGGRGKECARCRASSRFQLVGACRMLAR